ncbi:MAG: Na+/H+ antiporter subunit G [Candidatus Omnitrophica bacterium]|nr:Na+/H+ antiporter subunit G [Candidatus Omnitrophota bacterium]
MINSLGVFFIIIGLIFDVIGGIGLVRLPDVYSRLQAAFKCVTIGTSNILLGVLLIVGFNATGMKILVCAAFLIFTAPVAAHALLRAARRSGVPLTLQSVVDQYESEDVKTDE